VVVCVCLWCGCVCGCVWMGVGVFVVCVQLCPLHYQSQYCSTHCTVKMEIMNCLLSLFFKKKSFFQYSVVFSLSFTSCFNLCLMTFVKVMTCLSHSHT
jgi:hypothetical protein